MSMDVSTLFSFLRVGGAALIGLAVYWLVDAVSARRTSRTLTDFVVAGGRRYVADATAADMGTEAYKVRLAFASVGIHVPPGRESLYRWGATAALSLVAVGLGVTYRLPVMLVLALPAAAVVGVGSWIGGHWDKQRQAIEAEIPVLLTRLSSTIQVNNDPLQALDDVVASLSPGPLQTWLRGLVQNIQMRGVQAFPPALAEAEIISPSLHTVVATIERMWRTGGAGYIHAFRMSAENLATLLNSRAEAMATAAKAWSTIRVILLALGGAFLVVLATPSSAAMLRNPTVQVGLFFVVLWGLVGYWYIQGQIAEVL
ncbi:MAG TPA: hypothetical protein ENJ54_00100 [Chloroflexi bacterium]|nr:hypothetical protein [Chloroflexota bacterium]